MQVGCLQDCRSEVHSICGTTSVNTVELCSLVSRLGILIQMCDFLSGKGPVTVMDDTIRT